VLSCPLTPIVFDGRKRIVRWPVYVAALVCWRRVAMTWWNASGVIHDEADDRCQ
jgi:hypothetical protein